MENEGNFSEIKEVEEGVGGGVGARPPLRGGGEMGWTGDSHSFGSAVNVASSSSKFSKTAKLKMWLNVE
jgi:hypothetical protein